MAAKPDEYKPRKPLDIDIRPRGEEQKSYSWMWVAAGIVALIVVFALIIPAYKGFNVYQALKEHEVPSEYVTDMTALLQDKSAAESQAASDRAIAEEKTAALTDAQSKLQSCQQISSSCEEQATAKQTQAQKLVASIGEDLSQSKALLETCEADLKKSQSRDSAVVFDAARRLCCMQRVDNSAINAFEVADEKIVCVSEGGTAITC